MHSACAKIFRVEWAQCSVASIRSAWCLQPAIILIVDYSNQLPVVVLNTIPPGILVSPIVSTYRILLSKFVAPERSVLTLGALVRSMSTGFRRPTSARLRLILFKEMTCLFGWKFAAISCLRLPSPFPGLFNLIWILNKIGEGGWCGAALQYAAGPPQELAHAPMNIGIWRVAIFVHND